MEFFEVYKFFLLGGLLGDYSSSFTGEETRRVPDSLVQKRGLFDTYLRDCEAMELTASVATLKRIKAVLVPDPHPTVGAVKKLLDELDGRLSDELAARQFLRLSPRESDLYSNPRAGWQEVATKFPGVVRDIEEAAKCLALERHTASVFHLMRVLESGLRALGKSLKEPTLDPSRNPTWNAVLHRSERELQKPRQERSPEWAIDDAFYSTATANLRAVQYAWRNPGLHIEKSYDGEEAHEIHGAVRAFMRHLATKLSE